MAAGHRRHGGRGPRMQPAYGVCPGRRRFVGPTQRAPRRRGAEQLDEGSAKAPTAPGGSGSRCERLRGAWYADDGAVGAEGQDLLVGSWTALVVDAVTPRARRDTRHRPRGANREVAPASRAENRVQPRRLSGMKWSWPPLVSLVGARQPPGSSRRRSGTGCTALVPAPTSAAGQVTHLLPRPPCRVRPARRRRCPPLAFARAGARPRSRPLAGQRAAGRAGVRSRVSESRRGVYAPSASGTARGRCSARERSAGAGCRSRRRSVRGRLP